MSGEEPPATPADLARTLREAADRLMSGWTAALTGPTSSASGASGALPAALGPLAPPATMSARQLQTVLDDIAARRAQVQALRDQLGLFDEQLAALETSLTPVLEWTRTWAGMEQAMTDLWQPPRG